MRTRARAYAGFRMRACSDARTFWVCVYECADACARVVHACTKSGLERCASAQACVHASCSCAACACARAAGFAMPLGLQTHRHSEAGCGQLLCTAPLTARRHWVWPRFPWRCWVRHGAIEFTTAPLGNSRFQFLELVSDATRGVISSKQSVK